MNRAAARPNATRDRCEHLRAWFATERGLQLLETERSIVGQLLAEMFGYHLVQLGMTAEPLHEASPVGHKVRMGMVGDIDASFVGDFHHLPFAQDTLDVVVLQHVLDICDAPTQVLREASRVTIPSGYLVVVGFNPFSSWGLWKWLRFWERPAPFNSAFMRAGRLMDWLSLLDFRIDRALYGYYALPFGRLGAVSLPDFSQGLSRKINWPFGAVYVIAARKQVAGMTPLRPVWKGQSSTLAKLPVVKPAGRQAAAREAGGEPVA